MVDSSLSVYLDLSTTHQEEVLLIGDFILDKYTIGKVHRVSPEAPVTVLHVEKEEFCPGGACNVALNLLALGLKVSVIGRVGRDEAGQILVNALQQEGIDTTGVVIENHYITPLKERLIARQQQIVRVDRERAAPLDEATMAALLEAVEKRITHVRAIALSDYAKGMMTPQFTQAVIGLAERHGVPIFVDPKGNDFLKYKRATLIKPNLSEAMQFATAERSDLERIAQFLLESVDCHSLLVTRAEEGASLFRRGQETRHFPVKVRQVKDVTGAGDTALAALVYGVVQQLPLEDAVHLANLAAGIAVEQLGCVRVALHQLANVLLEESANCKVYEEAHLGLLHVALKESAFILCAVEASSFALAEFRLIQKLAADSNRPLVAYVGHEKRDSDCLQALSSLKEVKAILCRLPELEQLCLRIPPVESYQIKNGTLASVKNYKDLF